MLKENKLEKGKLYEIKSNLSNIPEKIIGIYLYTVDQGYRYEYFARFFIVKKNIFDSFHQQYWNFKLIK